MFCIKSHPNELVRYHQSTEILIDLDLFGFVISCAITFTDGAQQHLQLTSSIKTPSLSTSVASSKFIYSRIQMEMNMNYAYYFGSQTIMIHFLLQIFNLMCLNRSFSWRLFGVHIKIKRIRIVCETHFRTIMSQHFGFHVNLIERVSPTSRWISNQTSVMKIKPFQFLLVLCTDFGKIIMILLFYSFWIFLRYYFSQIKMIFNWNWNYNVISIRNSNRSLKMVRTPKKYSEIGMAPGLDRTLIGLGFGSGWVWFGLSRFRSYSSLDSDLHLLFHHDFNRFTFQQIASNYWKAVESIRNGYIGLP